MVTHSVTGISLCGPCSQTGINLKLTTYASRILVKMLQGDISLEIIEFQESLLNGIQKSYPELVDPGDGSD